LRANAAWHFFAAESITGQMFEAKVFTPEGIDRAAAHLGKSLARFPNNPDYLDLRGYLREQQAGLPGVVGRQRRDLLESAAEDYRSALAVRPLWPYSWANLLSVKDKLGQVDSEFNSAINRAAETGPWEPRVQLQIVRSGLRYWDELRRPTRALVQAKMADALRVQPREAFVIARFYGRPDLVCGLDTNQPQIKRWCESVL